MSKNLNNKVSSQSLSNKLNEICNEFVDCMVELNEIEKNIKK